MSSQTRSEFDRGGRKTVQRRSAVTRLRVTDAPPRAAARPHAALPPLSLVVADSPRNFQVPEQSIGLGAQEQPLASDTLFRTAVGQARDDIRGSPR